MYADKKISLFFNEENLKLLVELCNLHYRFVYAEKLKDRLSAEEWAKYQKLQIDLDLDTYEAVAIQQRLTHITALLKVPGCNVDYRKTD